MKLGFQFDIPDQDQQRMESANGKAGNESRQKSEAEHQAVSSHFKQAALKDLFQAEKMQDTVCLFVMCTAKLSFGKPVNSPCSKIPFLCN